MSVGDAGGMDAGLSGAGGGGNNGGGAGGTGGAGGDSGDAGGPDAGANGNAGAPSCDVKTGSDQDGDANIDLDTEYQTIRGFGGINVPGWIADLTADQAETAFGNGPGQLGLSILRVRIPFDSNDFAKEVPTAQRAVAHDAIVFATPWTPPANMKTNNNTVGGELSTGSYDAYADHLLSFRDYMESNGVSLYAISVQNEPDIQVQYESCDWSSSQFINWLTSEGSKFGDTKLIVAESFHFDHGLTDPILNNAAAASHVAIIGGHIYGGGLADYPLARSKGKEVWMTEHYTDSNSSANDWPLALDVGKEVNDCMAANFSAYVWWYIRRSYGLLTEDGMVSKRGYLLAQYAKFIRPGFTRVAISKPSASGVSVTAYKSGEGRIVAVAVNQSTSPQDITLDIYGGCADAFSVITTSGTKNLSDDGTVSVTDHKASVTLDAQSVTTFVGQ